MTRTHEIKLDGYGAHTTLAEDRPVMLLGTAESYGIEMLHVVSGKSWESLTITATFNAPDGTSTDVIMGTDGNIAVPTEATAKSGSGMIVFTGVSNGIQRISCDIDYFVVAHSAINGTQSGGTAPSWFEQAVTRFMPTGGTAGQVLTKLTNTDFDAGWQNSQGGAGLAPLVGTTQTITPSQVLAAIKAGRDIALQHTDSDYGSFVFSAFDASEQVGIVVSNSFLPHLDGAMFTLLGNADNESWFFDVTIPATKDDVGTAVNEALAQAKANGDFDGADGLTPTIGDNGNWYLGETDTGKPSRGDKGDKGDKGDTGATGAAGADGKSAYQYAVDGGYTGTEAEFAAKLAKEKFANPYALTFTGAVEGSYDGSEPLNVKIPGGGGAAVETWDLLINAEIAEDCTEVIFNSGDAGETLSDYKELLVLIDLFGNTGGFTTALKIGFLNAGKAWHSPYALQMTGYSAETVKYYINMFRFKKTEHGILPVNRYTQYNSDSVSNGLSHASGTAPPAVTTDFTLPISANQHVTTDMTDFTSQKEFERLVIGGYQAVIGAGTIIKVWGMK